MEKTQHCPRDDHHVPVSGFRKHSRGKRGKWCAECLRTYERNRRAGVPNPPSRIAIGRTCAYIRCVKPIPDEKNGKVKFCSPNHARKQRLVENPTYALDQNRKLLYGLDPTAFDALNVEQGGLCGICGKFPERPAVDHSHETGEVRGILCIKCNTGIAMFGDDPAILAAAIAYLKSPPAQSPRLEGFTGKVV